MDKFYLDLRIKENNTDTVKNKVLGSDMRHMYSYVFWLTEHESGPRIAPLPSNFF